jgi:hypothetical protein
MDCFVPGLSQAVPGRALQVGMAARHGPHDRAVPAGHYDNRARLCLDRAFPGCVLGRPFDPAHLANYTPMDACAVCSTSRWDDG